MVVDAVAGDPTAEAVTVTVFVAVTVSGIPERATTFADTLDSVIPVPTRSGAENVTDRPDTADALN
jgi:hypothetical protein